MDIYHRSKCHKRDRIKDRMKRETRDLESIAHSKRRDYRSLKSKHARNFRKNKHYLQEIEENVKHEVYDNECEMFEKPKQFKLDRAAYKKGFKMGYKKGYYDWHCYIYNKYVSYDDN